MDEYWSNYRFLQSDLSDLSIKLSLFNALVRGEPINRLLRKLHVEKPSYFDISYSLGVAHKCDRRTDRQLAFRRALTIQMPNNQLKTLTSSCDCFHLKYAIARRTEIAKICSRQGMFTKSQQLTRSVMVPESSCCIDLIAGCMSLVWKYRTRLK